MTTRKIRSSSGENLPPSVITNDDPMDTFDGQGFSRSIDMDAVSPVSLMTKPQVSRTLSNRSSQQTAVTLQLPGPGGQQGLKSKKLGHRRVTEGGEVTYKKFQTTQLIGSIQLGIHFSVGSQTGIPDRDILMEVSRSFSFMDSKH